MRVLLIDDDPKVAESLSLTLAKNGMVCDVVELGEEGLQISQQQKDYEYDIILLDLLLPDSHGYEILLRLRSAKVSTPIVILSALTTTEQKVKCLDYGADEYISKPFDRGELLSRLYALIRRCYGHANSIISFGEGQFTLNLNTRTVEIGGKMVHLTGKEYRVIELLGVRKGHVLTKEMFLNHLYGGLDEPELKIIDVFVCKLRKKLAAAAGGKNYIETVWGRGYALRDTVVPENNNQPAIEASQEEKAADEAPAAGTTAKTSAGAKKAGVSAARHKESESSIEKVRAALDPEADIAAARREAAHHDINDEEPAAGTVGAKKKIPTTVP